VKNQWQHATGWIAGTDPAVDRAGIEPAERQWCLSPDPIAATHTAAAAATPVMVGSSL